MKPYAQSCDENRDPILAVIRPLLEHCRALLEVGSGTGQHAVYFAAAMPHLVWHTSDRQEQLPGIRMWLEEARLQNVRMPLELDVTAPTWPDLQVDAVFSANTTHIMHWPDVEALFAGVGRLLARDGRFLLYGPFNYRGDYTSDSNRRFDAWLRQRDPASGLRDFAALERLAQRAGMLLEEDYAMPANNRILSWRKEA
jgi:cyclopropane fatty-acyl-phospholipid synthase-like methyltransferase